MICLVYISWKCKSKFAPEIFAESQKEMLGFQPSIF